MQQASRPPAPQGPAPAPSEHSAGPGPTGYTANGTGQHPHLDRYAVKAITGGTDALGEVTCLVTEDGITVTGQGSHTDIIQASALA